MIIVDTVPLPTRMTLKSDRLGAAMLLSLGILTIAVGVYFTFLRPAMLPEDIRFTGADSQLMSSHMTEWLRLVFQTWGAFMVGFGLLMVGIAIYLLTWRPGFLRTAVIASLLVVFTRFLMSNVMIRSDYLWFVGALFGVAALTALQFAIHARNAPEGSSLSVTYSLGSNLPTKAWKRSSNRDNGR